MELLIAFSLIALISLLLFSGLRLGTRAWDGVTETAESTAELRLARGFIERALNQAQAISLTVDAKPYMAFSGDAEHLEFVAPLTEHVGIPGLYVLHLAVDKAEVPRLVLTRWLLHPDVLAGGSEIPEWEPFEGSSAPWADQAAEEDEDLANGAFGTTVLVDRVDELELAYFGVKDGEAVGEQVGADLADWHEDWLNQSSLPLAVRLHLTTPWRSWPDMVVRLPELTR